MLASPESQLGVAPKNLDTMKKAEVIEVPVEVVEDEIKEK
jgi:hypothetical protein